jgi:thioredoxin reductase (NADPH)
VADIGEFDVVVIGAGLGGLTAGLVSARHGHSTLVLESGAPGGHLMNVDKIEDYPGFPEGVPGYDLCPLVQEQAANQGAEFALADVQSIESDHDRWLVSTSDGSHRARAVIVATGSSARELGVPGEERLRGRGVSHCASCDGPLFRGCVVGVVGGGDSGCQEALTLANFADRVIMFTRGETLVAQQTYRERVDSHPAISVRANVVVTEVLGVDQVNGVRLLDLTSQEESSVELAGVFVYIGLSPRTDFLQGHVLLGAEGHVPTDIWLRTERPGLFAIGDIRQDSAAQAIASAGDGATAAVAAHRYLTTGAWRGS